MFPKLLRQCRCLDFDKKIWIFSVTPRKINIEPENDGLEDDFPFPGIYSQVPC